MENSESYLLRRLPSSSNHMGLMCSVRNAHDIMVQYAKDYHESKVKEISSNLPVIGSLACPNCKSELQLKIEPITNSDILNAIKANDR